MNPKLTIIIPVCNCESLLKRALGSVSPPKDYQLILIDDGSEDEPFEVTRERAEHLSKLNLAEIAK